MISAAFAAVRSSVDSLGRDVRLACRALSREVGFTLSAILIAGLGIGASATVFNVFNALLLRPLPFQAPDRLVWIANGTSENLSAQTVQVGNLQVLLAENHAFADVAGFSPFYGSGDVRLTGTGEPERLTAVPVTERFFTLLGIEPQLGRLFSRDECQPNAPKTVLLDHAFWQRRFASDPRVVGQAITLDGQPATVVGVMPATFDFAGTFTPGQRADVFVPFSLSPETSRKGNTLALIGRLKPGRTLTDAQAEATVIGSRLKAGEIVDNAWRRNAFRPVLTTLRERISGRFRQALLAVTGAIGLLMLLVCANLSNLLLTRASVRQRDLAVRAALGAERLHLIRPLLVESLILSGAGAIVGLGIALGASQSIARLSGAAIPFLHDVRMDGVAVGFTMAVAILTGLAFGVLPALHVSRIAPQPVLARAGRGSIGSLGVWTQRAIVVAEIALVCVLLTGAGLLMRSLVHVLDVDLGFDAEHLVAVRVDPLRPSSTLQSRNEYFDDVLRNVRAIAGVDAAGLTDALPLGDNFGWRRWSVTTPGRVERPGERLNPLVRMIDEGYFTAMKIPLRAGRAFTTADTPSSEPVIIVNEALASLLWPGEDPLGRVIKTSGKDRRVVGVVSGVRYFAPERDSGAEMYMPLRQSGDYEVVDLVVRSALPPAGLTSVLRDALRHADRDLPLTEFRTMDQLVDRSLLSRRLVMRVIGAFAAFGLILASLGLYAVISYAVSQRRQEIGLRIALGASSSQVRRSVLTQTLTLALAGVAAGLPVSWIAGRMIQGLLFGVGSSDPLTFIGTLVVLLSVVALAGYVPAVRAARVDPVTALRGE
jgi:putative ABC transport system permease protein